MTYFIDQLYAELSEQAGTVLGVKPDQIRIEPASEKFKADLAVPLFALAAESKQNPAELAKQLAADIKHEAVEKAEAVSGFVNIWLKPAALAVAASGDLEATGKYGAQDSLAGQTIVTEYSDPNPFKVLHAGHLYTSIVGDAISNLFEAQGADVHRVNFGGDVGRHVAITMWAILQELDGENPDKLKDVTDGPEWLARAYVKGNNTFEENESIRPQVIELNKRLYKIHSDDDHDSPLAQIYWQCREWSYKYFDEFYAMIGTKFDKYYPESQTAPVGLQTVQEQLGKGVYEHSDGAVIFDGEKYGLHKRVFINSEGLPTYEAKDVGLIMLKKQDYNFDKSVVITGDDITEYMKVVLKSIEQFEPELAKATTHITHGQVKLQGGVKMSSRKGNILRAVDVLDEATAAMQESVGREDKTVVLSAVKYSFLRQGIGGDVIYDPKESVSLEGNSGPYVQYAAVRIGAILEKAGKADMSKLNSKNYDWAAEKELLKMLVSYPQAVAEAATDMAPQKVAKFAYDLARALNRYYENTTVIGSENEAERLALLAALRTVFENALGLLGIKIPAKM